MVESVWILSPCSSCESHIKHQDRFPLRSMDRQSTSFRVMGHGDVILRDSPFLTLPCSRPWSPTYKSMPESGNLQLQR